MLDGKAATTKLKTGKAYGHVARVTQYFGLAPADITVDSALLDTKQLTFDKLGHSWQWRLHLDAYTQPQEKTHVVLCHYPQVRLIDTVTVTITGHYSGQLGLTLDIS